MGQYLLHVKFANSTVKVPFHIVGKDGVKELEEKIKEIKAKRKEAAKK